MSSNIDFISTEISIFDDLAISVMPFEKKWEVKRFFELDMLWRHYRA